MIILFHIALKGQINVSVLFKGHYSFTIFFLFCRLHVNLQCGSDSEADIALHISPRYENGSPNIVYNTYKNGSWGSEQSTPDSPIIKGKLFAIEILVTKEAYKVRTLCRSSKLAIYLDVLIMPHFGIDSSPLYCFCSSRVRTMINFYYFTYYTMLSIDKCQWETLNGL